MPSNQTPSKKKITVIEQVLTRAAKNSHALLAIMIIGVIAMMVLPVPSIVLDALIAINIALSLLMLMLSIYISSALGLSTFPTLIVLTTVLRLSINIATTKQILLHAHAGDIIETFGRLIMGGSLIVGLVVFTVIAVVQFIVISKGGERVAEVAARFNLDALPGKQMAIDADLRAGFIDKQEARHLRQVLAQESQMYGSMDGAMKFVKGDAIAAILIAIVNIVGGVFIGTFVDGMSMTDALARYSLLSIGDGMVSQIPSLLISVAAGVLITRVSGQEDEPSDLATQIGKQVIEQPKALFAVSAMMVAFIFVPGFPILPFFILAVIIGVLAWKISARQRKIPSFDTAQSLEGSIVSGTVPFIKDSTIVIPLRLLAANNLRQRLSPEALQKAIQNEKDKLRNDLGLEFPALQITFVDSLADNKFLVEVQEVAAFGGELKPTGENLEVDIAQRIAMVVKMRPDAFVGTQEINNLVKKAQIQLPDLHEEVMKSIPMQRVLEVLRRLALEGVSLRYLREIYESLLTWAIRERDNAMLCEYVRIDLGRFICQKFIDERRKMRVITLDAATEEQIRSGIQQGTSGSYLVLAPVIQQELLKAIASAIRLFPIGHPVVLLATLETRRFLRKLLAQTMPHIHILSYPELPADVQIQSITKITIARRPSPNTRTTLQRS